MPTLDGGEGRCVGVHADQTLVSVSSEDLLLQLSDASLQSVQCGACGILCDFLDLTVFAGPGHAGRRCGAGIQLAALAVAGGRHFVASPLRELRRYPIGRHASV